MSAIVNVTTRSASVYQIDFARSSFRKAVTSAGSMVSTFPWRPLYSLEGRMSTKGNFEPIDRPEVGQHLLFNRHETEWVATSRIASVA